MLRNIPCQPDSQLVPFSQNSVSSFVGTQNHHGNESFQCQQLYTTNQPSRLPNQQQSQHNQPNVFSSRTGSLQPLNNIHGSANAFNQQGSRFSGYNKNQRMQMPANILGQPSNVQNCSYQAQAVPPSSQVPVSVSAPGPQPNLNTGMPSFGPSNVCNSFTKPAQHNFGNYQIQRTVSEVSLDSRNSQSELHPNKPENANLQPIQYHQLSNTQTGSPQQLGSIPPISANLASLTNQHSFCQQSSQLPNQITRIPGSNLPLYSQGSSYQKETSVTLPASASQPNPTGLLLLGQSSNVSVLPRQQFFGNYQMLGNTSEKRIDIGGNTQNHQGSASFQCQQLYATNQPNRLPNQQHNQPNVFSTRTGSLQPLNNIHGSANVFNHQGSKFSGYNKNQRMPIPANILGQPSNVQNCSYQAQAVPPTSQVLYHQLNASNTQTGSPQQLGSIPPISASLASVTNQHSLCQQSSQSSECANQTTRIPGSNLPVYSQSSSYQKETAITLTSCASQPNPTGLLLLGQSSNYQMLGNTSETSIDIGGRTQSEMDSEWVSNWLSVRIKGKTTSGNKKPVVAIPEMRKLLHQASTFLKALSLIKDSLMSCKNEDEMTWENKTKQAMNIKHRLEGLMEKLLQPEVVLPLVKKLRRMKKKRELHRRQREKRKMEKLEKQKRRIELHRSLDSYMEREKEKVLQAKREEELKKEADNILSEVRRKIQEGKRAQERLRIIEKLRQARKETAEKRGLHISEETDKQFSNKVTFLKEIMQKQLTHYDAEEKALKVMLETEQEGQLEQEEKYRKERQRKLLDKMQEEIKQCLFGDNDSLDASDPLWYFRQYYAQAYSSVEALIQTRRQWDMYLVPPTNAAGSSIPACWITPDPPSTHSWASALFLNVNNYCSKNQF